MSQSHSVHAASSTRRGVVDAAEDGLAGRAYYGSYPYVVFVDVTAAEGKQVARAAWFGIWRHGPVV